eukprot:TRINITY_DN10255_c0_g3_i1.p1 TRINITY_DN10255_c0_g3~~TRINITY_DN10255_c0_g3_i1.p1  ORF type:complete len:574 (+),score=39.58 TRINITY_DN10255_c0_g3_i1:136-1857(+)
MAGSGASFLETPTYVIIVVFFVFLVVQFIFEKVLHWLKHYLGHHGMHGLLAAVNQTIMELALMAFFSLLILIFESVLDDICVPNYADTFKILHHVTENCANCLEHTSDITYPYKCEAPYEYPVDYSAKKNRSLLAESDEDYYGESKKGCADGEQSLISVSALHHIHIFIFLLAVCHIGTASIIILLASWRVRNWRSVSQCDVLDDVVHGQVQQYHESMEKSGKSGSPDSGNSDRLDSREFNKMPSSVVFNEKRVQKTISRRDKVLFRIRVWVQSFFRQFYKTIDGYGFNLMRSDFIFTHKLGRNFQFSEYILRVMEYDFASMIQIGVQMWFLLIVIVLVSGPIGWMDFIALLVGIAIVLIVNTMLLRVLREVVCTGVIVNLAKIETQFWFNRPWFMLGLIRVAVFLNTIGFASTAFFAWQFGGKSCYFENSGFNFLDVPWWVCLLMNVLLLLDLGMVTVPLYSASAQMNSGARWQVHLVSKRVQSKLVDTLQKIRDKNKAASSSGSGFKFFATSVSAHPEDLSREQQIEDSLALSSFKNANYIDSNYENEPQQANDNQDNDHQPAVDTPFATA